MTSALYFAYGSNLASVRMTGRVPSACPRGPALLRDFALRLDKRGVDGSGKANLRVAPGDFVWGVVYSLDLAQWPQLDLCERDYARFEATALLAGEPVTVQTYRSDHTTDDPVAFEWYKQLMLHGAREHGLPPEWLSVLEALPARRE